MEGITIVICYFALIDALQVWIEIAGDMGHAPVHSLCRNCDLLLLHQFPSRSLMLERFQLLMGGGLDNGIMDQATRAAG